MSSMEREVSIVNSPYSICHLFFQIDFYVVALSQEKSMVKKMVEIFVRKLVPSIVMHLCIRNNPYT
jgi:hypothetical protein